jgi:methionyl-tRNA synthetase
MSKNKFYITTPIYYASGKPHIGHAFTTLYAEHVSHEFESAQFQLKIHVFIEGHM